MSAQLYFQIGRITCIITLLLLVASCSGNLTYREALNKNARQFEDPKKQEDAKFLVDAASFNILESKLAELAARMGYSSALVSLAKKNLEEHEDMADDLKSLARKKKIKLPVEMKEEHASLFNEVSLLSKEDFDKNFIARLERINEENETNYTTHATEAADADIRAFAARKLDMFKAHAQAINEVEKQLMETYR